MVIVDSFGVKLPPTLCAKMRGTKNAAAGTRR